MNEKPTTPSKYEGLGAAMAAELMIGFWFAIRAILAVKMISSLDHCIGELISRKLGYCQQNSRRGTTSNNK